MKSRSFREKGGWLNSTTPIRPITLSCPIIKRLQEFRSGNRSLSALRNIQKTNKQNTKTGSLYYAHPSLNQHHGKKQRSSRNFVTHPIAFTIPSSPPPLYSSKSISPLPPSLALSFQINRRGWRLNATSRDVIQ